VILLLTASDGCDLALGCAFAIAYGLIAEIVEADAGQPEGCLRKLNRYRVRL
jgi:hypothetical protein